MSGRGKRGNKSDKSDGITDANIARKRRSSRSRSKSVEMPSLAVNKIMKRRCYSPKAKRGRRASAGPSGLNNNAQLLEAPVMVEGQADHVKLAVTTTEDAEFENEHDLNHDSEIKSEGELYPSANDESVESASGTLNVPDTMSDPDQEVEFRQDLVQPSPGSQLRSAEVDVGDLEKLSNHPAFSSYIQKLVAAEVAKAGVASVPAGTSDVVPGNHGNRLVVTPRWASGKNQNIVKSPSDTTIYTPALKKAAVEKAMSPLRLNSLRTDNVEVISQFLEDVRVSNQQNHPVAPPVQTQPIPCSSTMEEVQVEEPVLGPSQGRQGGSNELVDQARAKASKFILEAEQFKASVAAPQGIVTNQYFEEDLKDDDDFFHITCHVEPSLAEKIGRGEFVDLKKLLPRSKGNLFNEPKTELIFKEGHPVFVQHTEKDRKILGVREWEQAFRIYATIYCQHNPHSAPEIWQYVYVINQAAASYAWSNVAEYDFAFRQMMAANPKRSWSKVYHQMWTICMTDSVNRGAFSQHGGIYHRSHAQVHQANSIPQEASGNAAAKQKVDKPCWRWNKSGKCKFGNNCRYINRCSYCDAVTHGLSTCLKRHEVGGTGATKSFE